MKRILILFGVIIFACRSSPEVSFDSLNQAFINWYFKYHPVESTRYNIKIKNGKYSLNTKVEMDEYYADISRFLIELSQIDATKISSDARIDYNILYARLERMKNFIENENENGFTQTALDLILNNSHCISRPHCSFNYSLNTEIKIIEIFDNTAQGIIIKENDNPYIKIQIGDNLSFK